MALKGRDREFRLEKLSYIDFKPLNMDRVLTMLFPRLRFDGYGTRRPPRRHDLAISDFAGEYTKDPSAFVGFDQHPDIVERWIETGPHGCSEPGQAEPSPGSAAPSARATPTNSATHGTPGTTARPSNSTGCSTTRGADADKSFATASRVSFFLEWTRIPTNTMPQPPSMWRHRRCCTSTGRSPWTCATPRSRIASLPSASGRPICWPTIRCGCLPTSRSCRGPCWWSI